MSSQMISLYVGEHPALSFRGLYQRRPQHEDGRLIAQELVRLGEHIGQPIETRVMAGAKPENVILAALERENFDLLVMGVMFRPSEGRLYFGPKVDHILRNARCALAVVVTPELTGPRD
jgi:nucleotide-binding universal stress UspA family protein